MHAIRRGRAFRATFGLMLFALLLGMMMVGTPLSARADVPALPVAAFEAPACDGETTYDPKDPPWWTITDVPNLLQVFGQRLADYNNGEVAVLYDSEGINHLDGYPAVCGTRFVEGIGAVSEWMFCTDIFFHVCSGTDANGNLLNYDGDTIAGMRMRSDGNPKLQDDQEKLIAYLIENGHAYSGTGDYNFGGTNFAIKDGTSEERGALQTLIWCISDPVDFTRVPAENSGAQRDAACQANMGAAEQQRLLAMIPTVPEIQLVFEDSPQTVAPGGTAQFNLKTNLYQQPIAVAATGLSGTLVLISGDATLVGSVLTVNGTDTTTLKTVTLGFYATTAEAGQATLQATAQPASQIHLGWNQSPGVTASDGKLCQVFATHNESRRVMVQDTVLATFALNQPTQTLPVMGVSSFPFLLTVFGLAFVGIVFISVSRMRQSR